MASAHDHPRPRADRLVRRCAAPGVEEVEVGHRGACSTPGVSGRCPDLQLADARVLPDGAGDRVDHAGARAPAPERAEELARWRTRSCRGPPTRSKHSASITRTVESGSVRSRTSARERAAIPILRHAEGGEHRARAQAMAFTRLRGTVPHRGRGRTGSPPFRSADAQLYRYEQPSPRPERSLAMTREVGPAVAGAA